jgi:cell division protein FtsB
LHSQNARSRALQANDEQQKELKALSEENEELAREVEELLLKKK